MQTLFGHIENDKLTINGASGVPHRKLFTAVDKEARSLEHYARRLLRCLNDDIIIHCDNCDIFIPVDETKDLQGSGKPEITLRFKD